jgi:hypothetical protein
MGLTERMYSNRAQKFRKEREERQGVSERDRSLSMSVKDESESSTAGSPPPYHASLSERQYTPFSDA